MCEATFTQTSVSCGPKRQPPVPVAELLQRAGGTAAFVDRLQIPSPNPGYFHDSGGWIYLIAGRGQSTPSCSMTSHIIEIPFRRTSCLRPEKEARRHLERRKVQHQELQESLRRKCLRQLAAEWNHQAEKQQAPRCQDSSVSGDPQGRRLLTEGALDEATCGHWFLVSPQRSCDAVVLRGSGIMLSEKPAGVLDSRSNSSSRASNCTS